MSRSFIILQALCSCPELVPLPDPAARPGTTVAQLPEPAPVRPVTPRRFPFGAGAFSSGGSE